MFKNLTKTIRPLAILLMLSFVAPAPAYAVKNYNKLARSSEAVTDQGGTEIGCGKTLEVGTSTSFATKKTVFKYYLVSKFTKNNTALNGEDVRTFLGVLPKTGKPTVAQMKTIEKNQAKHEKDTWDRYSKLVKKHGGSSTLSCSLSGAVSSFERMIEKLRTLLGLPNKKWTDL